LLKEQFAFEISRWQGKKSQEIVLDSSSGIIEASKTPLSKRINPVAIKLDRFAQWADKTSLDPVIMASTRIYEWAEKNERKSIEIWTSSAEPKENEILETIKQFPDSNPQEIMIWISPRNSSSFKEGTRIGVYQLIFVNGEKYLFFRTLCSYTYPQECAESAKRLLGFSSLEIDPSTLSDPEKLRATPLPLKISGNSLTAFLKKHLNLPDDVWETIAQGKDLAEKIKINRAMEELYTPAVIWQINQAKTWSQQAQIGTRLEQEFQRRTGRVLTAGSCGVLYSSFSQPYSPFSFLPPLAAEGSGRRKHCGKCGKYGYFSEGETCPYNKKPPPD
ncbi:MAG: hypothetical protein ACPLY7_02125, partial [Microgenomates group bacterium]